jgi:multidrug resistance efflux pump
MSKNYDGEIKARIVEIRFALSGKISNVSKHPGDSVKKWDLVASLDRKILQIELDQQLADYEKVRADWEGFTKKYPDPQDDNKYTKAEKQATLNNSVKEVELAKTKLDQTDLFTPVEGTIVDDSGIVPGLFVTPASGSIKIIDVNSLYFEFELEQKDLQGFSESRKCEIELLGVKEKINGETRPVYSDAKKFLVRVNIPSIKEILIGMKGSVSFNSVN